MAPVALLVPVVLGCGDGRVVSWDIRFGDAEVEARTRSLHATIQRGSCADRSTVEFAHEYRVGDADRPDTKPLESGSYAFLARAVDATCTIVAESCQTVIITDDGPDRVMTILDRLAAAGATCDECTHCAPSIDAGGLDAGLDAASADAGSIDAGGLDAGNADAGITDGGGPTDAGPLPRVDCAGTCDCEGLGYDGLCTDLTSIWWEAGDCWTRDCADEGLACELSKAYGWGCVPEGDGGTTRRCSVHGAEGACFDDGTLVWFDTVAGECRWRHCPSIGRVCAYAGPPVGFNCLPP